MLDAKPKQKAVEGKPGNLESWDAGSVYNTTDNRFVEFVENGKSKIWKSLVDDNQDNEPGSSSPFWQESSPAELQMNHFHNNLSILDKFKQGDREAWNAHLLDLYSHVQPGEREIWNGLVPHVFTNSLWVSPNGNNATAIPGRMDKPYSTIQAALDQTANTALRYQILVMPGVYTENVLSNADKQHVLIELNNVRLVGAGTGIALSIREVRLLMKNSVITSTSPDHTVRCDYGRINGLDNSSITNTGTGRAVYTAFGQLSRLALSNIGGSNRPAVFMQDARATGLMVTSSADWGIHSESINGNYNYLENCFVKTVLKPALALRGPSRLTGGQYRTTNENAVTVTNSFGLDATNVLFYSDTSSGFHIPQNYINATSFDACTFRGGTNAFSAVGFTRQTANDHTVFRNCRFWANTGELFNIAHNIYEPAGALTYVLNSLGNKAFNPNPANKYSLQGISEIVGLVINPYPLTM